MRTDVKGTRAVLRHSGTAPNKVRAVLGLIRGLSVAEARDVLQFCERGAAEEIGKLLDSAIANAEHNDHQSADELYVAACWADPAAARDLLGWTARLDLARMCEDSWRWQQLNPLGFNPS